MKLVVWVRLGEELRVICWELGALVRVKEKRRKKLGFSMEEGGDADALRALDSLTLSGRRKAEEGGVELGILSSCWEEKRGLDSNPSAQAAAADGRGAAGERTGI